MAHVETKEFTSFRYSYQNSQGKRVFGIHAVVGGLSEVKDLVAKWKSEEPSTKLTRILGSESKKVYTPDDNDRAVLQRNVGDCYFCERTGRVMFYPPN